MLIGYVQISSEEVNAGASSGYVSLKSKLGDSDEESENAGLPLWLLSDSLGKSKTPLLNGQLNNETEHLAGCTAGPFLTVLMEKVKNLLNNTIYINLHLTGLISRLAVYSHALLRTYLLDHSIVLQPNVPSLFQVRKQHIHSIFIQTNNNVLMIFVFGVDIGFS